MTHQEIKQARKKAWNSILLGLNWDFYLLEYVLQRIKPLNEELLCNGEIGNHGIWMGPQPPQKECANHVFDGAVTKK